MGPARRVDDGAAAGGHPPGRLRPRTARHAQAQDHAPRRLRPRLVDVPVLRLAFEPHGRPRHPTLEGRAVDVGEHRRLVRAVQPAQGRPPAPPGAHAPAYRAAHAAPRGLHPRGVADDPGGVAAVPPAGRLTARSAAASLSLLRVRPVLRQAAELGCSRPLFVRHRRRRLAVVAVMAVVPLSTFVLLRVTAGLGAAQGPPPLTPGGPVLAPPVADPGTASAPAIAWPAIPS